MTAAPIQLPETSRIVWRVWDITQGRYLAPQQSHAEDNLRVYVARAGGRLQLHRVEIIERTTQVPVELTPL